MNENTKSKLTALSLVVFFTLTLSTVYAACDEIFVSTNKGTYYNGDAVTISGTCKPGGKQDVAIQVNNPLGSVVFIAQPTTDNDGKFSVDFILESVNYGTYTVYVSNGATNSTEFIFTTTTTTTLKTEGRGGGGGVTLFPTTTTTIPTTTTLPRETTTTTIQEETTTTIPPTTTTLPPTPTGITGMFLTALASIGYWWLVIIALLIFFVWRKYRK